MEVKGVAKNPLAIIALFISFMYGAASLILGTSINKLEHFSQRALVIFLVAFPLLILFSFLFLVVFHHRKLYAPGDFRSDESFLAGVPTVSYEQKRIVEQEQEADEPSSPTDAAADEQDGNVTELPLPAPAATEAQAVSFLSQVKLAEELAANLLQRRLGGLLKRDVEFTARDGRRFIFDFAIEVKDTVYVGEVKYTRTTTMKSGLHRMLGKFSEFTAARISNDVTFAPVAVVVVEDRPEFMHDGRRVTEVRRRIRELKSLVSVPQVIIEALTMTELLQSVVAGEAAEAS